MLLSIVSNNEHRSSNVNKAKCIYKVLKIYQSQFFDVASLYNGEAGMRILMNFFPRFHNSSVNINNILKRRC